MNAPVAVAEDVELTIADARAGILKPNLSLALIVESPKNPRRHYDSKRMDDLVASLKQHGVLEPVLVRPATRDGRDVFELAAGHRRTRAARLAGFDDIPAIVRLIEDGEFLEILTISNLQREDVSAIEEAEGYRLLLDETSYDVPSLALKLGKSESYVYGRLKLLELDVAVREALARDLLQLAHATELGKVDVAAQRDALREKFNLDPKKLEAAASAEVGAEAAADAFEESPKGFADDDDFANDRFVASAALTKAAESEIEFRASRYKPTERPSVAELRRYLVENVYVSLSRAPFDRKDAELVPSAGARLSCPKRSGATIGLFPELEDGADACLDRACFHSKVLAHIERVVQLEADAHEGVEVVKLSADYGKVPKGVLKKGLYKPLGPSCSERPTKKARIGVYIDGVARGQAVWIKVDDELAEKAIAGRTVRPAVSTANTANQNHDRDWQAEQRERDEKKQRAQSALDEVLDLMVEGVQAVPLDTLEALRLVASVLAVRAHPNEARACLRRIRGDAGADAVKFAEVESELLAELLVMEEPQLQSSVLLLAAGDSVSVNYEGSVGDELLCLGAHFDLDVREIVKARTKELAAEVKKKERDASKAEESAEGSAPKKRGRKIA